jgi:hypothetical protein
VTKEADYLKLQATRSLARLRQTARTLGEEILAPLEIRPLIRRRPWWSLGSAAIAGFVSARVLRRHGRKVGSGRAGGGLRDLLASANRHARRILGSALGALVVANLSGETPGPAAPATNAPRDPPWPKGP